MSSQVVGGIENLLIFTYSGYLQLMLDGVDPIIYIQGLRTLVEDGRVSALKVSQPRPWGTIPIPSLVVVVVVAGGELGEVLKSGEVGSALSSSGFTVFHHDPQKLSHGWLGWWWRVAVRAFRSIVVSTHHAEDKLG